MNPTYLTSAQMNPFYPFPKYNLYKAMLIQNLYFKIYLTQG